MYKLRSLLLYKIINKRDNASVYRFTTFSARGIVGFSFFERLYVEGQLPDANTEMSATIASKRIVLVD
jgi:hypothetical protein